MTDTSHPENRWNFVSLTVEIMSAYVGNNAAQSSTLPELISSVCSSLTSLGTPPKETAAAKPIPHMPVKKTITPDYIISLEDGEQYKSLKRHLAKLGLSASDYRDKWSLPHDYPMVAANYAAQRSQLAKSSGLGRKRSVPPEPTPTSKKARGKKERAEAE